MKFYRLNANHEPEECSFDEVSQMILDGGDVVGNDRVGGIIVSTVFLAERSPRFETGLYGDLQMRRQEYSTYAEAVAGHARWVATVREEQGEST